MENCKKYVSLKLVFVSLWLTACASVPASTALLPTDEFHTVTPLPTIEAFEGISTIPNEQFLFIGVTGATRHGVFCDPPVVEALREPFAFYSESLELWWSGFYELSEQSWVDLRAERGAIGLYAFYDLSSARIQLFSELPYTTPDGDFIVTAVDADGTVAVRLGYSTTRIEQGKSIRQQSTSSAGGLCRIMSTTTLTNYGFIRDEQVTLR